MTVEATAEVTTYNVLMCINSYHGSEQLIARELKEFIFLLESSRRLVSPAKRARLVGLMHDTREVMELLQES